ncbi:peptide N-acetyl-beta-D-glucosaminyl asparaginase amidase A-domain-containing protein [Chiua virens]|nr:peptide N-acetyl-beta-D-glucosaminyl asparaginase amidase A-domain-containing protein [Chiua virens]
MPPPRVPKTRRYHWYAVFLFIMGTLFPPLGSCSSCSLPPQPLTHTSSSPAVAARFGIGKDFFLNLILTIAGYIPGHVHNFYIQVRPQRPLTSFPLIPKKQNVRNNKTHARTPKWAVRYGLVDSTTIRRHERRSEWANKYNDRNPDSGYDQQPLEDGQVGPSRTPTHDSADDTPRNGDGLWRPDDESYYSAEREGSLQTSGSGGRWRYPANFDDSIPDVGDVSAKKKKKKDRWARTEDAYSVSGQKKKKKKSKKRSTTGDATDVNSAYSLRSGSTVELEVPEEAARHVYGEPEVSSHLDGATAMVLASKSFCLLLGAASALHTAAQVLVDFQVTEPPPVPRDAQTCTIKILDIRESSGSASDFVDLPITRPPTDCGEPGSWAAVTLNFTVTSNGTQYDRLGVFSFHNTESAYWYMSICNLDSMTLNTYSVWRTSTPEPTINGIIWTYINDVTRYIPLFAEAGTFVLELDNIVETGLMGEYATTLYATFYAASQEYPTAGQSNLIVPISTMLNSTADDASVPPAFSLNVTLPQNTVEIYAELYASGNGEEEFWYFNVPDEYLNDLPPDTTYGGGPFREVRLLVDGQVAGVAFPYPVIFTGGINPSVWRPITSYGALNLPTYFLDLTPFAPTFSDGLPHNVTLDVASAEANHTLNQNWYVSGLLQVVTDPSGKQTTGRITSYDVQPYAVTETSASIGGTDVNITVNAQHSVHIEAVVISGSGQENYVTFDQDLSYTNTQYYLNNTLTQDYRTREFIPEPRTSILRDRVARRSSKRQQTDEGLIARAAGYFTISSAGNSGNGTSNNTFAYTDTHGNTYNRDVDAAYNVIVYDQQSGSLATNTLPPSALEASTAQNIPVRMPGGRQWTIVG